MGLGSVGTKVSRPETGARIGFVLVVLAVTWIGDEYPANGAPNFWYAREVMGVPLQYPALAGLALLLAPLLIGRARISAPARLRAHRLWGWTVALWLALMLSISFAIVGQAPEPFADWRNIIVVVIACGFTLRWLAGRTWAPAVILDLGIGYGIISLFVLARWALGNGVRVFDVVTPLFYWPALYMVLYAALVCTAAWLAGLGDMGRYRAWATKAAAVGSWLVLLLSFRRSFWAAGAVGVAIVLFDALRRRQLSSIRIAGVVATVLVVGTAAFIMLGTDAVIDRLASFLPGSTSVYARTNEDHVNDILEALRQIRAEPVTGLGIGQYYDTPLLAGWKEASFEVHNVILQVWLKFGLLGMIAFCGFHWGWFRAARAVRTASAAHDAAQRAVGAFLVAQFASTMIQTWVYGRFQMALQLGVLLGCLLVLPAGQRRDASARIPAAISAGEPVASN